MFFHNKKRLFCPAVPIISRNFLTINDLQKIPPQKVKQAPFFKKTPFFRKKRPPTARNCKLFVKIRIFKVSAPRKKVPKYDKLS